MPGGAGGANPQAKHASKNQFRLSLAGSAFASAGVDCCSQASADSALRGTSTYLTGALADIGIDRLRLMGLAIAAVENGLSCHHGDAVVI